MKCRRVGREISAVLEMSAIESEEIVMKINEMTRRYCHHADGARAS